MFECIMVLLSLNPNIKEKDQVISVILSRFAMKDIEMIR